VTHLPQLPVSGICIFMCAKVWWVIGRDQLRASGRRGTEVELAAMLGTLTQQTRASAREMLLQSGRQEQIACVSFASPVLYLCSGPLR